MNYSNIVFTPAQTVDLAEQHVRFINENKTRAINFPVPLDDVKPILPGKIVGVLAQTHNYKSGFLDFWMYQLGLQLQREERDEVIISISVEETIEEQSFRLLSHALGEYADDLDGGDFDDWDRLTVAKIEVGSIQIYRVGISMAHPTMSRHLYLSNIYRAIQHIREKLIEGREIAAIFLDYLQALPIDPEIKKSSPDATQMRRLQVRDDVNRARDMAIYFRCPVVIAIQAKQTMSTSSRPFKLPGIYDGEETSSIAQRLDVIFSLWQPKHHYTPKIERIDNLYEVAENDLWIKVPKQRGGRSGMVEQYKIDFDTNTITPARKNRLP